MDFHRVPVQLRIDVDGRCRRIGRPNALGASAAIFIFPDGNQERWSRMIHQPQDATRQRAELTAIILALTTTIDKFQTATFNGVHPHLEVDIHSHSEYAVNSLTMGYSWANPLWRTPVGTPMLDNQDLISQALLLERALVIYGNVRYHYVRRRENMAATSFLCDEVMDGYERGRRRARY